MPPSASFRSVPDARLLLCTRGLAVVFAEDVPDVASQDIHTSAYTHFMSAQQLKYDSLQPNGMTFAPYTIRLSTRPERRNTHSFHTRPSISGHFVYGLADYKDNTFTSRLQSCMHSCTARVWTVVLLDTKQK
jgi:hypothetical protein